MFIAANQPAQSSAGIICANWLQVNDPAFGLGLDNNYSSEEAWEVVVYNGQLYLGMEADNSLGARLWRTRQGVTAPNGQGDWEEVAADSHGYPFGNADTAQNDHIDSLAVFNNTIYASTANRGPGGDNLAGSLLYRSQTGNLGSWGNSVVSAGFGDKNNENFKDMVEYHDWLCGGTWNQAAGGQVWCSQDGLNWVQKNTGGFGLDSNWIIVHSLVFEDALYFGVVNSGIDQIISNDDIGRVYRTADISVTNPIWSEVYSGPPGSLGADLVGELGGYIYISIASQSGIVILRSPSGDFGSWSQVNIDGMDRDANNAKTFADSSTVLDGALYVAVNNDVSGFQVWKTSGHFQGVGSTVDWSQYGPDGWSDPNNLYAALIPFDGALYAWTSNFVTGQQVRRNTCPKPYKTYLGFIGADVVP